MNTAQYGIVDLITTITTVLAPVVILNIGEALMRFPLDKDADKSGITSVGIVSLAFGIVVTMLIIPIAQFFSTLSDYAIYLYLYVVAFASSQVFLCSLRGKERLLQYSIGNILNSACIAILNIIFLVIFHWGIKGYLLAYIIANFATAFYAGAVGRIKQDIRSFHIDKSLAIEMLKYTMFLLPNSFMWWITNSSDRIMVTAMVGAAANGVYAISYKLPTLLSTVSSIFNQAWSYSAIKENESDDREAFNNKIYNGLLAVTVVAALLMMLIMKPFLYIYVDRSYFEAWRYTPYLIVGFVFMSLASFLATPYTVNKNSKGFLLSASVGATLNVLMNYFMIPKLGVSGAAVATCISYIAVFIYRYVDTQKYVKIKIFTTKSFVSLLLIIVCGITMFISNNIGIMIQTLCTLLGIILHRDIWREILH